MTVADLADLRRALDYFYPAMLGVWLSHERGELRAVPLRETLDRQTGMYRVTQKITDDQAQEMIGGFCRTDGGCLKRILWPIAPERPDPHAAARRNSPRRQARRRCRCSATKPAISSSPRRAKCEKSRASDSMILRARTVVTMDGPPIENGAVAIEDNRIVAVGTLPDLHGSRTGR